MEELAKQEKQARVAKTFNQEWPLTLGPERILFFDGKVKKNAVKFYVNIACKRGCVPDIAFHLAIHFHYNKIIRNSRINGFWGDEECSSIRRFPFQRNRRFDLQILCTANEFLVAVNAQHTCSFAYRIPVHYVEMLHISGDIVLNNLHERKCLSYPITVDGNFSHALHLGKGEKVDNVEVSDIKYTPMLVTLSNGINVGNKLVILGAIKLFPHSFYINLQTEVRIWPTPDIVLQIKVEIQPKTIFLLCNSCTSGKWGREEVTPVFVFRTGHCFILRIECLKDNYSIIVNKERVANFNHRRPPDDVQGLLIQGDVYIDILKMR